MLKTRGEKDILYPELSYQIVGILFSVYNELGAGYREKQYERAIAKELKDAGLKFKAQMRVPLVYKGEKITADYLDFLIEDKIVLELKRGEYISRRNITQVYEYLKTAGLKLGILAHFSPRGVVTKRILNIKESV